MRPMSLFLFAIVLLACPARAADDTAKREAAKLQGTWHLVTLELDGQKVELAPEQQLKISIAADRIQAGEDTRYSFQLDATHNWAPWDRDKGEIKQRH